MKVVVLGSGRAASALAPRWREVGHDVVVWSRRDGPAHAAPLGDVLVFAVPDAVIAEAARALAERDAREVWLHLSGVHGSALLRSGDDGRAAETSDVRAGGGRAVACLHPLVALAPGADPSGAVAGIEGDAGAVAVAEVLARDAGLTPHAIPRDGDGRTLYHAAAVTVAGHATALFAQAMSLLAAAGFTPDDARAALQPLFLSAAHNLARASPEAVVTGPASRGDAGTVARHLAALGRHGDAEVAAVYRHLARAALALSAASLGERAEALRTLLAKPVEPSRGGE